MTPGLASRHVPGTYYYGAQYLFITRDRGTTWEKTADLTRAVDRNAHARDGRDGFAGEVVAQRRPDRLQRPFRHRRVAASPQVLWVGTDDGNVQVSRDGGKTWNEVGRNIGGAPDGSYISRIAASSASPGTAYVAVDNHRRGDWRRTVIARRISGRPGRPSPAACRRTAACVSSASTPASPVSYSSGRSTRSTSRPIPARTGIGWAQTCRPRSTWTSTFTRAPTISWSRRTAGASTFSTRAARWPSGRRRSHPKRRTYMRFVPRTSGGTGRTTPIAARIFPRRKPARWSDHRLFARQGPADVRSRSPTPPAAWCAR